MSRRFASLLCFLACGAPLLAQEAPRGHPQPDLAFVDQAAAALAAGRDQDAADLLAKHVEQNPGEFIVRAQLAELQFRLGSLSKARLHFELFLAAAQEQPDLPFRYVIHAHSRLVEIGEKLELTFDEHLHRGIGLALLAARRAEEGNATGENNPPALYARAAKELQAARQADTQQARAHFHLHGVWTKLGQTSAARAELAAADRWAATSPMTPKERRDLAAAVLRDRRFQVKSAR